MHHLVETLFACDRPFSDAADALGLLDWHRLLEDLPEPVAYPSEEFCATVGFAGTGLTLVNGTRRCIQQVVIMVVTDFSRRSHFTPPPIRRQRTGDSRKDGVPSS
jgi:hypothetical protein